MKINNTFKLIIAIVVSELAGIIGSLFTTPSIPTWYAALEKPAFNPPSWVFAPVWTTLFVLMGIAAFLVWKKGLARDDVKVALGIFIGQLVLNTLWSIIFFGLHNPGLAFIEIIFLWVAILATIIYFYKISKPAAWLLIPYILWVSFAAYLCFSIWQLSMNKINVPQMPEQGSQPIACTMDAKICPDGSAVGRTEPNCEFPVCPEIDNWVLILRAIRNCEVSEVFQAHDLRVTVKLKDGIELAAVEPQIDDIMKAVNNAKLDCKGDNVIMATE